MRKFLVWPDGQRHELAPMTFEEFTHLGRWIGGNDTAWNEFKSVNDFHELDDFDEKLIAEMVNVNGAWEHKVKLVIEDGEPPINWNLTYGALFANHNGFRWYDTAHPERSVK